MAGGAAGAVPPVPAVAVAERLVALTGLDRVFFSDDGSTAMEVALKLAYEYTRRTRGPRTQPRPACFSWRRRLTGSTAGGRDGSDR